MLMLIHSTAKLRSYIATTTRAGHIYQERSVPHGRLDIYIYIANGKVMLVVYELCWLISHMGGMNSTFT